MRYSQWEPVRITNINPLIKVILQAYASVCGCHVSVWRRGPLSPHEQTLSAPTVYQQNIPLLFPPPFCPTLLLCPSILISVLPSVSRSIFHFRFNLFDVLTLLLRRHLFLPFCLPLSISRPRPLSLALSHSLMESISLSVWRRAVNHHMTVSSVHSCGPGVCLPAWEGFSERIRGK